MSRVAYACLKCKREFKATVDALLGLLKQGRSSCEGCGGPLRLPAEIEAEHARRFGGHDLNAEVTVTCACKRVLRRPLRELAQMVQEGRARCQFCAQPLPLPQAVADVVKGNTAPARARATIPVTCPVCAADSAVDGLAGAAVLRCAHCQAGFRAPAAAGGPVRLPALDGDPAPAPVVRAAFQAYCAGSSPLSQLVGKLLEARAARQEVTAAEAAELGEVVGALLAWRPDAQRPALPLPLEEAAAVVPWLLFPTERAATREKTPRGLDLVLRVGEGSSLTAAGAWNLVNLATATLGAGGVIFTEADNTRRTEKRLRVSLLPAEGGVELQLATQTDDGRPSAAGAKAHAELAGRIAGTAETLGRYYALRALFGPFARGATPLSANPGTIARRVAELGLPPGLAAKLPLVVATPDDALRNAGGPPRGGPRV